MITALMPRQDIHGPTAGYLATCGIKNNPKSFPELR